MACILLITSDKYFNTLGIYYMPGTVLSTWGITKREKTLALKQNMHAVSIMKWEIITDNQ